MQGHKDGACTHDHSREKDGARNNERNTANKSKPKEESTYGRWMIIKKLTRWKSIMQQPHPSGGTSKGHGLNQQEGEVALVRKRPESRVGTR